ncbi:hypothetical protein [Haloparvum sedimenti]|uniref:hypothetical protein n=1 Tax=Haloparvum sedimenti TaxID=1678448 RepID=UPI00071E872B|nr:hypothetical protein [Haloparvum sedimenti]
MSLSRREILAGIVGTGTLGALGGVGGARTVALLSDRERAGGLLTSGDLELAVELDCADCAADAPPGVISFTDLDRGDEGRATLAWTITSNPGRLWVRTTCPSRPDPLGDALRVTVSLGGTTLAAGSLTAVREALAGGVRLDDRDGTPCLDPETPLSLVVEWALPADAPAAAANETTELAVSGYAEQCRHMSESAAVNPFEGLGDCPDEPDCATCPPADGGEGERIASATFAYAGPDGVLLEIVRSGPGGGSGGGGSGNGGSGNGNAGAGDVAFSGTLADGDEFDAVLHDPPSVSGGPDFDVVVDGAVVGGFHISCSQPFGPGLVIGDGTHDVTVLEAVDTDGSVLCEVDSA